MSYFDSHPQINTTRKRIFPVVHVDTLEQTLTNVTLAHEAKADGVFLINHRHDHRHLCDVYAEVRRAFPDMFIGLNFLDRYPWTALQIIETMDNVSALWVDNVGVEDNVIMPWAEDMAVDMERSLWNGVYFGGTAFKHQKKNMSDALAARSAREICHVVTTSGAATGSSAKAKKLHAMKWALDSHPLATASGFSIENAAEQLVYLDAVLVATSVLKPGDDLNFDPDKLNKLVAFTHQFIK